MIEIEGYERIEQIGHGGLGDVYRAVRSSTGGTVAIKVLRDVSDQSVAWHRTRRELTALVELAGHAHVVQLFELTELPSGPALIVEYAPGGSIGQLIERRPLTLAEIVLVGRQTAAALDAAHGRGIVHRDVKPQNLLVDAYGQVKLCDFGIAALARSDDFRTRTSSLSLRYASPEDLDDGEVGPASDVYSLGATLLHLAHGAPPTMKERLAPWTPPPGADPATAALDAVIAACLHPDPGERPTAAQVVERLERIESDLPTRQRALAVEPAADPHPPPQADADEADAHEADAHEADADGADAMSSPDADGATSESAPGVTDAPTVARPGRRDPERRHPDRPAADRPDADRRRTLAIVAGVVATAAVVVGVIWLGGSRASAPSGPAPAATPASTAGTTPVTTAAAASATVASTPSEPAGSVGVAAVARPGDLAEIESLLWPDGPVGECLVQPDEGDALVPVACDEPHDLQRIATGELDPATLPAVPDEPTDEPTVEGAVEAAVEAAVVDLCRSAFASVIGIDADASELDAPITRPSAASWAEGDRRYQCFVGIAGLRLVGDARGAEQ